MCVNREGVISFGHIDRLHGLFQNTQLQNQPRSNLGARVIASYGFCASGGRTVKQGRRSWTGLWGWALYGGTPRIALLLGLHKYVY